MRHNYNSATLSIGCHQHRTAARSAAHCRSLRAAPQLSGSKQQARASPRCPAPRRHGVQVVAVAARDVGAGLGGTAAAPPAEREQEQQQQQRGHPLWRAYPHINRHFPGLELVHDEPPVFVAHGFLSPEDCAALRRSAEAGELPRLEYDNAVLVDVHRLWPLLAVVLAGAAFDTWHSGGLAAAAGSTDALLEAALPALLKWGVTVGGLLAAALAAMRGLVGGRVFTGTKWTAANIQADHPIAPATARFLHRTAQLLEIPADRLEPPTVTRYLRGQYQRLHFDARPAGDPDGLKQFLEAGGQRLVQVVVYLNSLQPDQGGETRFFNPLLKGLAVQPRQGDALIFFPAFADGRFDDRMAHAGMPVKHGCKWICNTWACERPVPRAVTHLPLPNDEQ